MERIPVESSQIASVGYDKSAKRLEVEFVAKKDGTPGAIYEYDDVPEEIYEQLIHAQSVGKYFNQFVKFGFTFRKLEPEATEDCQHEPDSGAVVHCKKCGQQLPRTNRAEPEPPEAA